MAAPDLSLTGGNVRHNLSDGNEFNNVTVNVTPSLEWNYHIFSVGNNQTLTVNGQTNLLSTTQNIASGIKPNTPIGVYGFTARGSGNISLNGNINAFTYEDVDVPEDQEYTGVNLFYAVDGGQINVGSDGTKTVAWALGDKPDLISAKNGGIVNIKSTHNQLIGSIDFMDANFGTHGSSVTAKFDGSDSFWFGDDQSFQNTLSIIAEADATAKASIGPFSITADGTIKVEKEGIEGLEELLTQNLAPEIVLNSVTPPFLQSVIESMLKSISLTVADVLPGLGDKITDDLNLEFSNGAQWTYFGIDQQFLIDLSGRQTSVSMGGISGTVTVNSGQINLALTPKRISAITLNGGIINLYDEDIQNTWAKTRATEGGKSLLDLWPALKDVKHDYVRIGKLEGNGGIFRLDLNSDDPANSDMVFVESSDKGGMHYIEPYNPQKLASVSDTNRVTFAVTSKDANNIKFADKVNIYGERLVDYELGVDSEPIDNEAVKEKIAQTVTENYDTFTDFDINDFEGGTNWFINRLTMTQSAASVAMRSAGYASYDTAVRMDRHDRRLHDAVFQNDEKDGLWVRVQYGEAGAEHIYESDLTSVYVGYEKATSPDNRLGVSFAYTDGDTDFKDVKGLGEIKRYEASVYDTMTFGAHYVDLVARFGQVENEFDSYNAIGTLKTSGDFEQKYAAISAEYGYTLKDSHNVFIEPQLQVQAAYLDGYTYRTERDMKVQADSDVSIIGRAGLRFGKAFDGSDMKGELYARADVLHQFTDGQDAHFIDPSNRIGVTWGDTDTWSTFGVGGYMNIKDNVSFQVDVERTAGGETADTWLVSGKLNYLF